MAFESDSSIFDEEQETSFSTSKKIIIFAIIALVLGGTFLLTKFINQSYTGYVIADVNKVTLNEMAYKDSQFSLSSAEKIPMKSVKLSGKVIGDGKVNVYLNLSGEKKLIYTNRKKFKLPLITGFVVYELGSPSEETALNVDLDEIKLEGPNNNILSGIKLMNKANKEGMDFESIKITWFPDNGEKLVGLKVNNNVVCGYGQAGSPSEPTPSGTTVSSCWGPVLTKDEFKTIDALEFDSNMDNKQIIIELFIFNYLPAWRIGKESPIKIHLDLSGKKESYVEGLGQTEFFKLEKKAQQQKEGSTKQEGSTSSGSGTGSGTESSGSGSSSGSGTGSSDSGTTQGTAQEPTSGTQTGTSGATGTSSAPTTRPTYQEIREIEGGRLLKTAKLETSRVSFEDKPDIVVEFKVIEDPKYKEIFENTPRDEDDYTEISNECGETCILDQEFVDEEYNLIFDVEEGTAVDVSSIDMS